MNEPAVMEVPNKTFPMDVHDYDGNPCSHRKHIIFMERKWQELPTMGESFAYPKDLYYNEIGLCRCTVIRLLDSDNVATWEHLWIANIQVQRMSISEWALPVLDIGGFAEPSGELYTRLKLGVFHPFAEHTQRSWRPRAWAFDEEVIDITRKFVNLRYQLLPYLYTMFWQYIEEEFHA
jgi:alpha-glucosidase